ncbi:MAG: hypothetical protein LBE36_02860 [Flavobacteriaceae bacterium]|nr:hypothetical protein [Flavobacteriaceae bacterium]
MEKIVLIEQNTIDFLINLTTTLFEKEYFGFKSSAYEYIDRIFDFITNELKDLSPQKTPNKIHYLGKFYNRFTANDNTSWYIFFDYDERSNICLVKEVRNNHQPEIQFLNREEK